MSNILVILLGAMLIVTFAVPFVYSDKAAGIEDSVKNKKIYVRVITETPNKIINFN